ncbi:MAG TPA: hypothetical protein VL087_00980 [Nitrospirota bacterium]|nr:hypothetical protein [Nitrospirota bacterium]
MYFDRKTGNIIIPRRGSKGGAGWSILSIDLDTSIERGGKTIFLSDLDLGAANLNTYLGVLEHTPTIADFVLSKVLSLENSSSRPRQRT